MRVLREIFVEPPKSRVPNYVRVGLLVVALTMMAWDLYDLTFPIAGTSGDPYGNLVSGMTLLLVVVAFAFRYPPRVTLTLRIIASGWFAFAVYHNFYLSRILYPR